MIEKIILKTDRLLLRPFQSSDVNAVLEYRNDDVFSRFLPHISQPFTLKDAQEFVTLNMSESWETSPTFAIVFENEVIGTVNLEIDLSDHSAMLGYAIGRSWWGKGIATEAAEAVLKWAIQVFPLTRIWASTDHRNRQSLRVLEKLGMSREGIKILDCLDRDGNQVEEIVYSINLASWE